MKFAHCVFGKNDRREVTPRRLAAAKRAVQRDADAVALFPELRRETTAEARLKAFDDGYTDSSRDWRNFHAKTWRDARRRLAALRPTQRAGLLRYWNTYWIGPRDATSFASHVTMAERGRCFWHQCFELRRFYLVGQRRLSVELIAIRPTTKSRS